MWWLDPCSTLETWYTLQTCQVLTSVGVLRLPLEQLLQVEGLWEFSGDLRMLMLYGDFWHAMTQDSPEDMQSFWKNSLSFPRFSGLCMLCSVAFQTQMCCLHRGLKENGPKWAHFLKSQQLPKQSVWQGLSEGYHRNGGRFMDSRLGRSWQGAVFSINHHRPQHCCWNGRLWCRYRT